LPRTVASHLVLFLARDWRERGAGTLQGKDRTVLNLPFYMASIIPYVHKKDLKRQLNRQFIAKHPDIVPDLTLSKLRKYAPRPLHC
jgi:hypothetical protein